MQGVLLAVCHYNFRRKTIYNKLLNHKRLPLYPPLHENLLGTEAKHNDILINIPIYHFLSCSTFEEVTGLNARAHVLTKEIISISGQSKTK